MLKEVANASLRVAASLPHVRHAHSERTKYGFNLALKPFAISFLGGIYLTFPEEANNINTEEFYKKSGALIPIMVKLNDCCDIGVQKDMDVQPPHNDLKTLFDALYTGYYIEREMNKDMLA